VTFAHRHSTPRNASRQTNTTSSTRAANTTTSDARASGAGIGVSRFTTTSRCTEPTSDSPTTSGRCRQ
jgi:hypothetical protein